MATVETKLATERPRSPATFPRGIRARGTGLFVDCTVDGVRRTATIPSRNLAEAVRVQAVLRAQLLSGETTSVCAGKAASWTLAEGITRATRVFWRGTLGQRTAELNARAVLDGLGGNTRLTDITGDMIDQFVSTLQEHGNSNATVNRKLAVLSKVFRLATERASESHVERSPVIHRLREGIGRVRWLTQSEEQAILSLMASWSRDCQAEATIVLLDTGMRLGELWRISEEDCQFDVERPLLRVYGQKNKTYRSVPMTARVRQILQRRCEVREAQRTPLFPYTNRWYRQTWDRVKTTLRLDRDRQFVPHCLRHTCASRLVHKNVSLKVVQEWMGHKSITTTMLYSHLSPTSLFEAVKMLEV